jgi:hypothetical protein
LGGAHETFVIRGTGDRNNPLRRQLSDSFTGQELFVHFRLEYDTRGLDAASLDAPTKGDGEFFVLWLDAIDGGDRAMHHGGVPNVGVHVDGEGQNRFMVRYHSSQQQFSDAALVGDREYQIVVRLSKSKPGEGQPFDQLAIWLDPLPHQLNSPAASVTSANGISSVEWFGFATGKKTEPADTIKVSDIRLAKSWRRILGLPDDVVAPRDRPALDAPVRVARTIDFTTHVFPILKERCLACHSGADAESEVRLDVLDELLNHVTPREASASRMMTLLRSRDDDQRMPPPGEGRERLTDEQIATLATWIDEGLDWDERLLPTPVPKTDHWAFQPITRPPIPIVKNTNWVRTPVDAFIARRHEQLGITPAPLADARILARRLALDITGLPLDEPPPSEIFGDKAAEAREDEAAHIRADALVERMLATVAYGERWGRHWLDLARWAESNGHQHNRNRPHAWRYRDYVIRSFQEDKPFDQFIREQLAGDELPYSEERLIATGFLAAARYSGNELDHEIQRNDILVDVVNTTAKALLGITMECAQCHTHKFDPFSIRDYYRMQAFFTPGQPGNVVLRGESSVARELIDSRWKIFDDAHVRVLTNRRASGYPEPILVTPSSVRGGMKGAERELFLRSDIEIARLPQAWSWNSPSSALGRLAIAPHEMRWPLPRLGGEQAISKTYLRIRGDVKAVGPEVQPGWPAVFGKTPNDLPKPRTALADWVTGDDNPLTARVWVNRIWQWHFGIGLVATSGDFGTQGQRPSHPELLDWLATELIDSGWSTKRIQRLILQSNTFRQASTFSAANHALDPENETRWRWRPRRLEAEAIRDSLLAVADMLDRTTGGPSDEPERIQGSQRRSIYLRQKRRNLPEAVTIFDSPAAVVSCSHRRVSTVSLQPLFLLNSHFVQSLAASMENRVRKLATTPEDQLRVVFWITLGRKPDAEEQEIAHRYMSQHSLKTFCHAMMNLNEFLYLN